jgi:hypothetical protein
MGGRSRWTGFGGCRLSFHFIGHTFFKVGFDAEGAVDAVEAVHQAVVVVTKEFELFLAFHVPFVSGVVIGEF